jgi:hypothetical protein
MRVAKTILLIPLIALWFVVAFSGVLIALPVELVLKRAFGWDPHDTPDHQGHLELTIWCGLSFLVVGAGIVIWLLCFW